MREFKSLSPEELPDGFDVEVHGDEPIVSVDDSKGIIVISYTFPGFHLSEDSREVQGETVSFTQINIGKVGFVAESGKPLLPSFGRYVQIPFDCSHKVSVKKGQSIEFDDVLVLPAQEELTDQTEEKPGFEYDKQFYSKDELYPHDVVQVTGPFEMDGYNTLLVHVRPLQYNPAKRKLIGFGNVSVIIHVTSKEGEADKSPLIDPELDREAYGNLLLNPRRGIEERMGVRPEGPIIPIRPRGPEFIIIYHDTFKKAAEKLANWKNMGGLITELVSIGTVGNTVGNIKKYIRNKRRSLLSRLRYVLLFGDKEMIESETIAGGPYGSNVTDHYYSTPKDPAGPADYVMPWLSIGRIPVQTAGEAEAVVNQVIAYEKNPPGDSEFYRRMCFGAYFQDDWPQDGRADRAYMKTMEDIREHMVTLGFDVERIYVSNNPNLQEYIDGTPVPQEVKDAIVDGNTATNMLISSTSEGQLVTGHRDHGGWDGWVHPSFKIGDLAAITTFNPTIFFSVNCQTGRFDLAAPSDCFAEDILKMKGGAPSLVAATRNSHTWLNNDLMKGMFDAVWAGILPTFPGSTASYPVKYNRLGDIMNYAKSYLPIEMSGGAEYIKDHFEIYHVVGDPTIHLWRGEPLRVTLRAMLRRSYLYIKLSSCPKGSVITIWHKDKLLKRIRPSSTHIKMSLRDIILFPPLRPLPPPWRLPVYVCFWAPGCRFRRVRVRIW